MTNPKTILATTYAVNPYKGSEDGMGWNFVCQIARFNKVIAITRENNREHIEKYMRENPDAVYQNMQFLYFDLPYWMRFWKKGSRGAMLYYWLWQQGVVSFVRKQNIAFDIVHNLNFHNDWTPSHLWKLNKPFVWGPIGHHPIIPHQYLTPYSLKYRIKDRLTWMVKKLFWNLSPALRTTVKKADYILCMNPSVSDVLPLEEKQRSIMPSVATEDFGWNPTLKTEKFTLISAGRLVPLKGFDLSIAAFADFLKQIPADKQSNCTLQIIGSGPELEQYRSQCRHEGILDHVQFLSWVARKDLLEMYKKSSAFLFPSHEGAGMVVAEALSFGLPVICIDNSGPGAFIDDKCGFAIPVQDYQSTVEQLSAAILELYSNPDRRQQMAFAARARFERQFHWDRRGEQLQAIYQHIV